MTSQAFYEADNSGISYQRFQDFTSYTVACLWQLVCLKDFLANLECKTGYHPLLQPSEYHISQDEGDPRFQDFLTL